MQFAQNFEEQAAANDCNYYNTVEVSEVNPLNESQSSASARSCLQPMQLFNWHQEAVTVT